MTEHLHCIMTYGCRASGHAGAYMTAPPSAIFWSRPRMHYPPRGDITTTCKGGHGLRARAHLWRGSAAERDASCMLLE